MKKDKSFTVNSYFQREKKKFDLVDYFFGVFYRSLIPLFCLIMSVNFWEIKLVRFVLLVLMIFFVLLQFEVKTGEL